MPPNRPTLDQLQNAFANRQIAEGYLLLADALRWLRRNSRNEPPSTNLLLTTALWVDVGYPDDGLLDELVLRFVPSFRRDMPLSSYLELRLVEAWRAMSREEEDTAIRLLEFVLNAQKEFSDSNVSLFAHYFKARAHRKKGEYEPALADTLEARRHAQELGLEKFGAVIQIQEAWLLFQKGKTKDAVRSFDEAEQQLRHTDDYLSLANIESARGRIVRRAGEYHRALKYYENAIAIYSSHYPQHRNLARTLINAAYVKRLLALQLRKRIDRKMTIGTRKQPSNNGSHHARYLRICQEALGDLEQAGEIYALHDHHGGTGSALVNAGYLHLDQGSVDRAAAKSFKAYEHAHRNNDHILMARARILESSIENVRVDEQLSEEGDLAVHANTAKVHAEDAVALATHTQNRRLLAGAWIALGLTAANDFFEDWEEARRCAARASVLLSSEDRDHLWEELLTLKARILHASGVDETLRAWSEGMVGNKTFQQVQEEFAEIVIPKVWAREGKNISRVVERLSISPKKIRRILRNTGLSGKDEG
jgi:tetratricopeptide (TPR) repeat protein